MDKFSRHQSLGFTLVEIAIVLIIASLLLGGLITPLTAQIDQRNYNETKVQLAEIRESIVGFALSHLAIDGKPYLPCPDTDGDGVENRAGNLCASEVGSIPTQSLGLKGTDVWERDFVYRVSSSFANNATGFTLSTVANIDVLDSAGGNTVVTNVPALILSTGKNGIPPATNLDEEENTDNNVTFVSREFTPTYDDIVVWVSPNILFNRMVTAGVLP